jgi:signal transduction histidine kinase
MYIGASYLALNKADSAIEAFQKSMRYAETSDANNYIPAGIYLADAYHLKKDYTQQRKVLEQLVQKSDANDNLLFNYDLYGRLAELNYETGNFKEAYEYNVKYNLLKDSFYTQQNHKTVQEIEARYQTAQKEKALSEKQLQLSEKNLALERSNRYILFAVSGFVIASLLASGIYLQSQNKKKAYHSKLQTLQKLKEIDMLSALMQGEEKERTRIAKDLHDGVAGMLAAVKMHFNSLVFQYESLSDAKGYQQGIELLNEATLEVRKTSHNLMPEVLIRHGLDEALIRYCSNISNSNMMTDQYDSWGEPPRFKCSFELSVYRIVQELLNNILKHSKATEALVQMGYLNDLLSITIEDNGVGFDKLSSQAGGIGLHSLQSRIKAMNGEMEVETEPGRGVSVFMEFETSGLVVENKEDLLLS